MPNQRSVIQTNLPVRFRTLSGDALSAVVSRIELRYDAADFGPGSEDASPDVTGSCELLIEVGGETLQAIVREEWFHLFHNVRQGLATFEADRGAKLRLALRPAMLRKLATLELDAEDVLDALLPSADANSSPLSPALVQTESWLAIELKQTIGLPEELAAEGSLAATMRTEWREIVAGTTDADADEKKASTSLYDQVMSYLEAKQLSVEPASESHLKLRFHTDDAEWGSVIRVDEEEMFVVLYSVFPVAIPAPLREESALAFMGEHYGNVLGCYEMDPGDGELRYRTSLQARTGLDPSLFAAALSEHLTVMKRFVPIVEEVIRKNGL